MIYDISLETIWWELSNVTLIVRICLVVPKIIANETCSYWWSWSFVVAFVHPIYVQIAIIWGIPVQCSL